MPYFLVFFAAFFCLAVFVGSFLVVFFAFFVLAIFLVLRLLYGIELNG